MHACTVYVINLRAALLTNFSFCMDDLSLGEDRIQMASSAPAKFSLTILLVGASGTGKSALVNGLVSAEVAKEGSETLFSQTIHITPYKTKKIGTDVSIWDTPGMETVTTTLALQTLVTDVQNKVRNVDLVLFCINMTSARFRQGDNQNVRILTKAFGESFWKNAVFVLTFANQVKPPPSRKGTPPREYFDERLQEWKGQISAALKRNGVSDKIAESIKMVPTGYRDDYSLPGQFNWLNDLWGTCQQVSKDKRPIVLQVNMVNLGTEEVASHPLERRNQSEPFWGTFTRAPFCYTPPAALAIVGGVVGSLAGGPVGGAAGIAVGAVCGMGACAVMKYLHR